MLLLSVHHVREFCWKISLGEIIGTQIDVGDIFKLGMFNLGACGFYFAHSFCIAKLQERACHPNSILLAMFITGASGFTFPFKLYRFHSEQSKSAPV